MFRLLSSMRSAISARILVMGTSLPSSLGAAGITFAGAGFCTAGCGEERNLRMSSLETRPPAPVPGTSARFTLCSLAILRTSGEERTTCGAADSSIATLSASVDAAGSICGAATAPVSPTVPPTTATTVLICTVAPSGTRTSVKMPATGEGISASTLSVEISKRGSSTSTRSPARFSHLVMVPSKMDSPICGITTRVPLARCGTTCGGAGSFFGAAAGVAGAGTAAAGS